MTQITDPNISQLKEYIVTLHRREDLDGFYEDMETPGGNLYIPNRAVDVANRRPISRNTHYWLTAEEAAQIKQDPRVWDVSLTPKELGIVPRPQWSRTANFTKTVTASTNDKNWGPYRILLGNKIAQWGLNGTPVQTATINYALSGKNVDVVIVDGHIKADHAEFKTNVNGTGTSRVNQFNWFSLSPTVTGGGATAGTYDYADDTNNTDHGTHVAGIAAGNTHGLAIDANIFNISPYGDELLFGQWFDYIRAWHNAKPINPATGVKNPTVVNNSYGGYLRIRVSDLNTNNATITHRGTVYNGPWNSTGNGTKLYTELGFSKQALPLVDPFVSPNDDAIEVAVEQTSFKADLSDAIADGIHIVFASGNDERRLDVIGGLDFDNKVSGFGTDRYINRFWLGGLDGNLAYILNVGNIDKFVDEPISSGSNKGPGVNIWAPGGGIVSAIGKLSPFGDANDPRGLNGDRIISYDGTSMAAPQVTGFIATLLELKPNFSPADMFNYVRSVAKTGLIDTSLATTNSYNDPYSLQGSTNLSLFAPQPTFVITVDKTSASQGTSITYTITTTNVPNGSTLYLTEQGTAVASDFVDNQLQFTVSINSNTGTLTRVVSNSFTGTKLENLAVRTGGFSGTVHNLSPLVTLSQSSTTTTTTSATTTTTTTVPPTTTTTTSGTTTTTTTTIGPINFNIATDCNSPAGRILINGRTGASTYINYNPEASLSAAQSSTNQLGTSGPNSLVVIDGLSDGTYYVKVADAADTNIFSVKSILVNCSGTTTTTTTTTTSSGTTTTTTTTTSSGTTTTTTTTASPQSSRSFSQFAFGVGLSDCCNDKDNYFRFVSRYATGSTPGTTTTTTSSGIPSFTLPPVPTTTLGPDDLFVPIKDLVPVKATGRRFIARLRTGSETGPIVSNSKIISITNLPTKTALPNSFTDIRLSGKVFTNKTKTFHQKTIVNIGAADSINDLFTANACYDDRVYVNVQGRINGTVYGGGKYQDNTTSPYSEDSDINTAVVHAGLVAIGERAIVKRYFINYYKGYNQQFVGSSNNNVTSLPRLEGCGYYFDPNGLVTFPPPAPPVFADDFYYFKETFTATANQTIFTTSNRPGDYISQQCLVFQNGVMLDSSEYTDIAGSTGTVTLLNNATTGDIITVMSFRSSNFKTGAYPSFTRHSTTLTAANQYTPSGFSITKGLDLIFVNGVILPENDYTITSGVLNMQAVVTGILTIIKWSLDVRSQPIGNPLNTTRNTQVAQTDYHNIISFEPVGFNLYNNGVLMVDAVDYTGSLSSYSLTVPPTSNLNTLLQQTFTRI